MMQIVPKLVIPFTFLFALLGFTSCNDDCNNVNCGPRGGAVAIRYLHNEQNAFFGDHAILTSDSITFYNLDHHQNDSDFAFVDSIKSIVIYLHTMDMYALHLGKKRVDTFQMTEDFQPRGRCCPVTIPTKVMRNGEVLCEEFCEDVIEVEL